MSRSHKRRKDRLSEQSFRFGVIGEFFHALGEFVKFHMEDVRDVPNARAGSVMRDPQELCEKIEGFLRHSQPVPTGEIVDKGLHEGIGMLSSDEAVFSSALLLRFCRWLAVQLADDELPYGPDQLLWDVRRVQMLFVAWLDADGPSSMDSRLPRVYLEGCDEPHELDEGEAVN